MQAHLRNKILKVLSIIIVFNSVFVMNFLGIADASSTTGSITSQDVQSIVGETPFYYGEGSSCQTSSDSGGSFNSWLQAEALVESHDDPTADSGDGAYGKYQIIPATWHGYAAAFYQPALQYATANLAPESVQDAVVYLANIPNYKNFNGDPFWLAVNWYWPADDKYYPNKSAPALDTVPAPGNSITVAGYGNLVSTAVSSGSYEGTALSSVNLSYSSAPDFQTYLTQDGGAPPSSPTSPSQGQSGGSSSGCSSSSSNSCTLLGSSQAVTGPNASILCEAEKYTGIYYLWGGGHDGYAAFRAACPESAISSAAASSTAGDPGPCGTDCSGLVSVAVDGAYNQSFDWTVGTNGMVGGGSQYWQSIPISQAEAGDIVTFSNGSDQHVEIVEYVQGSTVYSFGSHETGTQTGPVSQPSSFWNTGAWRYTGPGSGGSSS